jgi:hypothetical protein
VHTDGPTLPDSRKIIGRLANTPSMRVPVALDINAGSY